MAPIAAGPSSDRFDTHSLPSRNVS
jgi:hypothetical protein